MMVNSKTWLAVALALAVAPQVSAQTEKGRAALTAADRAEIEVLNARYSLSLGMCNAEVWPYLFAPDGYFASASRGKVEGQHRLAEMNRSYDCVYIEGVAPAHAPAVLVPYKISIEATPDGAAGFAYYNGGRYDDVYTKTKAGWRFRSRTAKASSGWRFQSRTFVPPDRKN